MSAPTPTLRGPAGPPPVPAALLRRLSAAGVGPHSARVARLAAATSRALGLRTEATRWIVVGALLHDVGKFDLPRAVLDHRGPLSAEQWAVVRQHPVLGERAVRAWPGLAPAAPAVRHSHERWDGTGYPDRLAGRAIPLAARVVVACDAFDAIASDRPYRPSRSWRAALGTLADGAGTQFDERVVAAVTSVVLARLGDAE
jgi:two-component system cell cycle response regulator